MESEDLSLSPILPSLFLHCAVPLTSVSLALHVQNGNVDNSSSSHSHRDGVKISKGIFVETLYQT